MLREWYNRLDRREQLQHFFYQLQHLSYGEEVKNYNFVQI